MEVETIADCLNIIDYFLVEGINTIRILESIHKFLIEKGQRDFIADRIVLSKVLSQITSMIENKYQFPEADLKNEYVQLRKIILLWLEEGNTKPEVDNQY